MEVQHKTKNGSSLFKRAAGRHTSPPRVEPITIAVPGEPVAWARAEPRRGGKGKYTPEPQASYMAGLRRLAEAEMHGDAPFSGPVMLEMLCEYEPPRSWSKKRRLLALGQPMADTPDYDNLAKILDAWNGVVFRDDRQISDAHIRKRYGTVPQTVITVKPARRL